MPASPMVRAERLAMSGAAPVNGATRPTPEPTGHPAGGPRPGAPCGATVRASRWR